MALIRKQYRAGGQTLQERWRATTLAAVVEPPVCRRKRSTRPNSASKRRKIVRWGHDVLQLTATISLVDTACMKSYDDANSHKGIDCIMTCKKYPSQLHYAPTELSSSNEYVPSLIEYSPDLALQYGPLASACSGRWSSLPKDIHELIHAKLPYEDISRSKLVSKDFNRLTESESFHCLRGQPSTEGGNSEEGLLTALYFFLKKGDWYCAGFDMRMNMLQRIPPLTYLPAPDPDLFKEYLVCASQGLMCMNVSKSSLQEQLMVFNPLTRKTRVLPPLTFRRSPVLMHMLLNPVTQSYRVVVAGSSRSGDGHLSRKTEVFDSCTSKWMVTDDLPGPEFALNEYQTGVCVGGILYCIAFLSERVNLGLLSYDVEKGKWLPESRHIPLPIHSTKDYSMLQLVENDEQLYLFTERENGRHVERCIHVLEMFNANDPAYSSTSAEGAVTGKWRIVVRDVKIGTRGLQIYPELACAAYRKGRFSIFNTIEHTGSIYDVQHCRLVNVAGSESLPPVPPQLDGEKFCSLNPLTFTFVPNYKSRVY